MIRVALVVWTTVVNDVVKSCLSAKCDLGKSLETTCIEI